MKTLSVVLVLMFLLLSCSQEKAPEAKEQSHRMDETAVKEALHKPDPAGVYGEGVQLSESIPLEQLVQDPASFEGKTVLVQGVVTDVCQNMGCWVEIADAQSQHSIRVKVDDGVIVFPLSAKGHSGLFEGTVEKMVLSVEQARKWKAHEAEEKGETIDTTTITEPMTIWRIRGKGAKIES